MSAPTALTSSDNVVTEVIDDGQVSGQQILVVGLCMLFNMLDGFDIIAMAVVASAVSTELGLAADMVGLIFSFALAGMMGASILLTATATRPGSRTVSVARCTAPRI
jgi:hypothetical protein